MSDFQDALKTWECAEHVAEGEWTKWTVNPDGSMTITLPSTLAFNFADTLNEWDSFTDWMHREDCKNWKRSPIARENRRESIVLGNCLSSIRCLFGYRETKALMERVAELMPALLEKRRQQMAEEYAAPTGSESAE